MVKYPFWVRKVLHYTTQHEGGLSAYMSLRALATTTTSSCTMQVMSYCFCLFCVPHINDV